MGTQIDLPQEQAEAFGRLSDDERQACEALIQTAVADYLQEKDRLDRIDRRRAMEAAFGIWKGRGIDGLEYERAIRAEWDRDWDK